MNINFAEFHFIRPYWLWAIVPAVVLFILLLKNKLNQGSWSNVCDPELLPFVLQNKTTPQRRWTLSAGAVCSLLTIIALAGPTWERLPSSVFRNDAALVIALDLSYSMDSTDIKPSRLSRARYKIADILKRRKDGQTALIVYAGDAFVVTPLTEDTETIASQISALTTEIMPSQGSNTVAAIEKAVTLLKQTGLQKGEILLVTDGVGVDFDKTIDVVKSLKGYHLSVLGVGTADGAPIKMAQGGFIKDAQGNIVVPKLDSSVLSRLTKKGNGRYQTISGDDSDIESLLDQFDNPTEKVANEDNGLLIDQWSEKGPWLLLLVLPFAAFSFRKGLLTFALLCLFPYPKPSYALEWNDLWQTQNQQAHKAFNQKNYQQSAKQFNNPQWKGAAQYKAGQFEQALETLQHEQSATGLYNQGNALAQSGKLTEAIEAYNKSLQIGPDNADAKYNKEQVEKQLEKQNQQQGDEQQKSDHDDSKQSESKKENNKQDDSSEQSGEQSDSEQQQNSESSEQQSSEPKQSEQTQQNEQEQDQEQQQKAKETESQQTAESSELNETEQANEQWLKRIPDDPAGLLKRKFKYQYGQRGRNTNLDQAW